MTNEEYKERRQALGLAIAALDKNTSKTENLQTGNL